MHLRVVRGLSLAALTLIAPAVNAWPIENHHVVVHSHSAGTVGVVGAAPILVPAGQVPYQAQGQVGYYPAQQAQVGYYPAQQAQVGYYPVHHAQVGYYSAQQAQVGYYPAQQAQVGYYPAQQAQVGYYPAQQAQVGYYPAQQAQVGYYPATMQALQPNYVPVAPANQPITPPAANIPQPANVPVDPAAVIQLILSLAKTLNGSGLLPLVNPGPNTGTDPSVTSRVTKLEGEYADLDKRITTLEASLSRKPPVLVTPAPAVNPVNPPVLSDGVTNTSDPIQSLVNQLQQRNKMYRPALLAIESKIGDLQDSITQIQTDLNTLNSLKTEVQKQMNQSKVDGSSKPPAVNAPTPQGPPAKVDPSPKPPSVTPSAPQGAAVKPMQES